MIISHVSLEVGILYTVKSRQTRGRRGECLSRRGRTIISHVSLEVGILYTVHCKVTSDKRKARGMSVKEGEDDYFTCITRGEYIYI